VSEDDTHLKHVNFLIFTNIFVENYRFAMEKMKVTGGRTRRLMHALYTVTPICFLSEDKKQGARPVFLNLSWFVVILQRL